MVDDIIFANLGYSTTKKPPRLTIPGDSTGPPTPRPSLADKRMSVSTVSPNTVLGPGQSPPPSAYTSNPELVWQRRFNHAMDEIRDLQAQLQVLRQGLNGSSTCFRRELSGLRNTLGSVLRKETVLSRNRSLSNWSQSLLLQANTEGQVQTRLPAPHLPRGPPPRLQLPDLKTANLRSRLHKISLPPTSPTVMLSMNGVDLVLSPKEISTTLDLPTPPFTAFPRSPLPRSPLQHFWGPDTPAVAVSVPPSPGPSATDNTPMSFPRSLSSRIQSICKWTGVLISGYVLGALLPSSVLLMIVLGCAANSGMRAFAEAHGFNHPQLGLPKWSTKAIEETRGVDSNPLGIS